MALYILAVTSSAQPTSLNNLSLSIFDQGSNEHIHDEFRTAYGLEAGAPVTSIC